MITIILTYRNRAIDIVKRSLDSLSKQSNKDFSVQFVNYGSNYEYSKKIEELTANYNFINLTHCKTEGQLWNKCRAINIALKKCETPYVFVGDVDMLFHPDFIENVSELKKEGEATYFQVGFLDEERSKKTQDFQDNTASFLSDENATGMTLFSTKDLKAINGYDEFYHGWGAEDTDVHVRLSNNNVKVNYYTDNMLLLHQWHPKHYRTKTSLEPFHSHLEQINHAYLECSKQTKKTRANVIHGFGNYSETEYNTLQNIDFEIELTNKRDAIKGFINNILFSKIGVVKLVVSEDNQYNSIKHEVKKRLGKKTIAYLSMQEINDMLLEVVVRDFRNKPYVFEFNRIVNTISLTININ